MEVFDGYLCGSFTFATRFGILSGLSDGLDQTEDLYPADVVLKDLCEYEPCRKRTVITENTSDGYMLIDA